MKHDQFQIQSIELTHDNAVDLRIAVINAIENYGIENFEKKTEIELPDQNDDPIKVFVTCEIYTEYGGSFQYFSDPPEPERILERSVSKLIIQFINEQGDEVQWTVLGEYKLGTSGRFYTATPIDIEEQIKEHFRI